MRKTFLFISTTLLFSFYATGSESARSNTDGTTSASLTTEPIQKKADSESKCSKKKSKKEKSACRDTAQRHNKQKGLDNSETRK
ncbi:MAG: hypothetical protein IKP81_07150 [Paludibacteraceae bacterium]|nr:hypothetical protein [Paludibacteraceae bacterium]